MRYFLLLNLFFKYGYIITTRYIQKSNIAEITSEICNDFCLNMNKKLQCQNLRKIFCCLLGFKYDNKAVGMILHFQYLFSSDSFCNHRTIF